MAPTNFEFGLAIDNKRDSLAIQAAQEKFVDEYYDEPNAIFAGGVRNLCSSFGFNYQENLEKFSNYLGSIKPLKFRPGKDAKPFGYLPVIFEIIDVHRKHLAGENAPYLYQVFSSSDENFYEKIQENFSPNMCQKEATSEDIMRLLLIKSETAKDASDIYNYFMSKEDSFETFVIFKAPVTDNFVELYESLGGEVLDSRDCFQPDMSNFTGLQEDLE